MAYKVWVQDADPGTQASPLDDWFMPTSGAKWQRRNDGTGWVYKGQVNDPYDGALSRSGPDSSRTMAAAISGPAGMAGSASPDFGGFPKRQGVNLQTQMELDAAKAELYARVRNDIIDYFGRNPIFSDVSANLAVKYGEVLGTYGTLGAGYQIPLPTFKADGLQATDEQVIGWHARWTRFMIYDNVIVGVDRYLELQHLPNRTVKMVANTTQASFPSPVVTDGWPDIWTYNFGFSYIIIAAR